MLGLIDFRVACLSSFFSKYSKTNAASIECLLKRSTVSLDFHKYSRGGYDVSGEGGGTRKRLLDDVLETSVVQQQLSEYLFQYFHTITEISKVGQYAIINLLYATTPLCGELAHQGLHQYLVQTQCGPDLQLRLRFFSLCYERDQAREGLANFLLGEELPLSQQTLFEPQRLVADHAPLLEDGQDLVVVVDEEHASVLGRGQQLGHLFEQCWTTESKSKSRSKILNY